MMPFDDAISYMQQMAQDESDSAATFLKMMYNVAYKIILTEFGRQVTESERTTDLAAGQRTYQMPPDCAWPKTLELHDGSLIQPLVEVTSDQQWAYVKSGQISGRPTHFRFKPRFGVGGGLVELFPIPSSDAYDLRMIYETRDRDLSALKHDAGTVTVTEDSDEVVGASAAFTNDMIGRYFVASGIGGDGMPYRVIDVTDASHLQLENSYAGEDKAGLAYKIVEIPNLPDDMQIIPCYFALEQWWSSKGNGEKQKEFKQNWILAMARAKKTHATVTRNGIINQPSPVSPFPAYPINFPAALVE